jgi:hypothetical protein
MISAKRYRRSISAAFKLQGTMTYQGLPICIENKKGTIRKGVEPNGKPWSIKMPFSYGYVDGTKGVDGDEVDVFIGPNPQATHVFIVHQKQNKPGKAKYDEDKCFLGWDSADEAKKAYHSAYNNVNLFHSMTMMSIDEFKEKLGTFTGKKLHASLAIASGGPGSGRHAEMISKMSEWREHLWHRNHMTRYARRAVKGKDLHEFHPGNITVYRGTDPGRSVSNKLGTSWSKSKTQALKNGSVLHTRTIDENTPAIDVNKVLKGVPSKSSIDKEVFIAPTKDLKAGGPGSGRHKEFGSIPNNSSTVRVRKFFNHRSIDPPRVYPAGEYSDGDVPIKKKLPISSLVPTQDEVHGDTGMGQHQINCLLYLRMDYSQVPLMP